MSCPVLPAPVLQKLPTLIGSNVTIGQGAIIHGATIQDCVVVGMGATVMDGVTVRRRSACCTAAPCCAVAGIAAHGLQQHMW